MKFSKKQVRRVLGAIAALSAVIAVITAFASPAPAAGPVPVECNTAGRLSVDPGDSGQAVWDLSLEGICSGNASGTSIVTVAGSGTSSGAGVCDGSGIVTDLAIDVTVTERNVLTGTTVTTPQTWTAPATTYPGSTPMVISGGANGAGTILTRIFLNCGEAGNDNTWAVFSFTS